MIVKIKVLRYFLIFIVGFLSIESAFQVNMPSDQFSPVTIPHPAYHHFHEANAQYVRMIREGGLFVERKSSFTDEGLRDWPRKKGFPEIIFLGGSMVEGVHVDLDDLFGNLVEKKLGDIDIVNVVCSSWSSILYYVWTKKI